MGSSIAVTTARPMGEIDIQRDGRKKHTLAAKPIIEVLKEISSVGGNERMREKKDTREMKLSFPLSCVLQSHLVRCDIRPPIDNLGRARASGAVIGWTVRRVKRSNQTPQRANGSDVGPLTLSLSPAPMLLDP